MEMAEAVGAPKGAGWDDNSRIALGTAEVSPLNQAGAYATFANDGTHVANHVVTEVRDANDKIVYKADPEEKRAVSEDISRDVTYALSNVVEQGTGGTVRTLNRPVAGKTGTKDVEDDIVSAWFVGLHPADLHRGDVRGRRRRQRRPRRLRAGPATAPSSAAPTRR